LAELPIKNEGSGIIYKKQINFTRYLEYG